MVDTRFEGSRGGVGGWVRAGVLGWGIWLVGLGLGIFGVRCDRESLGPPASGVGDRRSQVFERGLTARNFNGEDQRFQNPGEVGAGPAERRTSHEFKTAVGSARMKGQNWFQD